ncbi:hypothetical protein [Alienimonas californiensis]|uniref:Outer membrane efflux protein n=1 Tax=Alienimonas californiensis TaxID=2527989 RepID=A0A517P488_9PLAN|nr:hypothetical protein [Alienimonas californiensis]QDT14197.1 hypothetical protein CA12_02650 [Alienimonas californiensis]
MPRLFAGRAAALPLVAALPLAAALLLIAPAVAAAQAGPVGPGGQTPSNNPTLSPYLGLLNRNNTTAFNYYGFVRPQQRITAEVGQLRQSLRNTQSELSRTQTLLIDQPAVDARLIGTTGHGTSFGNTAGFFGRGAPQFGGRR